MRNNSIHCLRNLIVSTIFLNILPHKIVTNNWTRINLNAYRNSTILSHTSPFTKHSNPTCLRSKCNMSTSRHTAAMLIHDTFFFRDSKHLRQVRFRILTAVTVKISILRNVTTRRLVHKLLRFVENCCLHFLIQQTARRHTPEYRNIYFCKDSFRLTTPQLRDLRFS
jgi:hypothetical protein